VLRRRSPSCAHTFSTHSNDNETHLWTILGLSLVLSFNSIDEHNGAVGNFHGRLDVVSISAVTTARPVFCAAPIQCRNP
jgi:hypothetical protein